jgi:hypothetical protein
MPNKFVILSERSESKACPELAEGDLLSSLQSLSLCQQSQTRSELLSHGYLTNACLVVS